MQNSSHLSRRHFLWSAGVAAGARPAPAASTKPMRGIFIIMATPYTQAKEVDYEDLAREVDFLDRCGVHGMVWPQLASEYFKLSKPERMRGMEVIAKAARGKKPALVLGVQGPNVEEALEYLGQAERFDPDALIAIPPTQAKTLEGFRQYYARLAQATKRPLFIQTTGGAKEIKPEIAALVQLAREYPHVAFVKEEFDPVIPRMLELASHRPAIKGIFSGQGGRGMTYEMRLGFDGTMPGAPYSDIYAQIWDLYQAGEKEKSRDLFARLLLMINLDQVIPGTRSYIMQRRGVFKTQASRVREVQLSKAAIEEIEFNFAALKPYLRV